MTDPALDLLASAWLDGEVDGAEAERVARYLDDDPEAAREVARWRALGALVRELRDPDEERVLGAMDRTAAVLRRRERRRRALRWTATLAAAALILAACLLFQRPDRTTVPAGGSLELAAGTTLRVGPDGAAEARTPLLGDPSVRLVRGQVELEVAPEDPPVVVETPWGRVRVEPGGRVGLERDPATGRVEVEVEAGEAVLEGTGERLGPGARRVLGRAGATDPSPTGATPDGDGPPEEGAAATPTPSPEPDVLQVPDQPGLAVLLAVREAGRDLSPDAPLRGAVPSLLALDLRDLTPAERAAALLAAAELEGEADRRGARLLLGDVAADDELSPAERSRIVARFRAETDRAAPLDRRLAVRGLGAALPLLEGEERLGVAERLDAVRRTDPDRQARYAALAGLAGAGGPFAREVLAAAARDDPDPDVRRAAERLLESLDEDE